MHLFLKKKIFHTRLFIILFLSIIIIFLSLLYHKDVFSFDALIIWDKNEEEDIAGYRIYCREEDQKYNYDVPVWVGTDVACTIYKLDDNVTYYFVARAFNTSGIESEDSAELRVELIDGEIRVNTSTASYDFVGNGCFINAGNWGL